MLMMNKGNCHHPHNGGCDDHMFMLGNSIEIDLNNHCDDAEIRADIKVAKSRAVRVWGIIRDCDGNPIPYVLLKLVRVVCSNGGKTYQGVAHTVTDCEGVYQFDLCDEDSSTCYKIFASKANTGSEAILDTGDGNCDVCTGTQYDPCKPYTGHVVAGTSCPPCRTKKNHCYC